MMRPGLVLPGLDVEPVERGGGVRTWHLVTAQRGGTDFAPVTSITSSPDGRIYVCHRSRPAVLILDTAGKRIGILGEDEVTDPHGITTDALGNVYIADRDRHVVWIFGADGSLVGE